MKDIMPVQSVLFDKDKYTLEKARHYLYIHHLRDFGVDDTPNFYRFRQFQPPEDSKYYTLKFHNGVQYIIHY